MSRNIVFGPFVRAETSPLTVNVIPICLWAKCAVLKTKSSYTWQLPGVVSAGRRRGNRAKSTLPKLWQAALCSDRTDNASTPEAWGRRVFEVKHFSGRKPGTPRSTTPGAHIAEGIAESQSFLHVNDRPCNDLRRRRKHHQWGVSGWLQAPQTQAAT